MHLPADDTAQAALELDRGIRYQLLDSVLRPAHARDFRRHLTRLVALADEAPLVEGRFRWAKRFLARLLQPFQQRQAQINLLVAERLAELYDLMGSLPRARAEMIDAVSVTVQRQLEELRAELRAQRMKDGRNGDDRLSVEPGAATQKQAA